MKKLSIITRTFILSALMLGGASCHDDKGNYDYTAEMGALTISRNMYYHPTDPTLNAFVFKQNEDVVIEADYTINDKTLEESDLEFEWILGDKLVGTKKTLILRGYETARYWGVLLIKDTRYNLKYYAQFSFQIDPAYTSGWAILSEQGGFSQLGYLHKDDKSGAFEFIGDVYGKANEGAKIEAGVVEMRSHSYNDVIKGTLFGLSIVQPGVEGPIDLNPKDMSPYGKIKGNFLDNAGASLNFKGVIYKNENVYAITDTGDIYIRDEGFYGGSAIPHSGKFPSEPVYSYPKMNITKWINNSPFSNSMVLMSHVPIYDDAGKKCRLIRGGSVIPFSAEFYTNAEEPVMPGDPGWDGTKAYPEIQFPGPENLSGYKVISMEGGGYDTAAWIFGEDSFMVIAMILQRESDGQYFFYSFDLHENKGNYNVDLSLFYPLPADIDIDPETMVTCSCLGSSSRPIFFFTTRGNTDLHYWNATTGIHRKVYTASSPITAIHTGEVNTALGVLGDPGIYNNMFVVGTESGDITVLNMSDQALALGNAPVIYTTNPGVGPITQIEYLPNDMMSY